MGLFRETKSPLETKLNSLSENLTAQFLDSEMCRDMPDHVQLLIEQYYRYIATILAGVMLKKKLIHSQNLTSEDPIIKQIFRLVFIESINFQETFIVPDIIQYDILAHESLKDRNRLLIELISKNKDYLEDLDHAFKTSEPYYLVEFEDEADDEFSGYKNYYSFLRDVFFIEVAESLEGIEIKRMGYTLDWNRLKKVFTSIIDLYLKL